jgi:hypothetical protein
MKLGTRLIPISVLTSVCVFAASMRDVVSAVLGDRTHCSSDGHLVLGRRFAEAVAAVQ